VRPRCLLRRALLRSEICFIWRSPAGSASAISGLLDSNSLALAPAIVLGLTISCTPVLRIALAANSHHLFLVRGFVRHASRGMGWYACPPLQIRDGAAKAACARDKPGPSGLRERCTGPPPKTYLWGRMVALAGNNWTVKLHRLPQH